MDAMAILTVALAAVQMLMGVVMFLWGRVLSSNQASVNQLRASLESVVKDNADAMRELRGSLEGINTRLLADTLPRTEFERYRREMRDDMKGIYDSINAMASALSRMESMVTNCPQRKVAGFQVGG